MLDYDDVLAEVEREEKVDSAAEYLEKKKRIKKEINRLKKLFRDIDANKKKLVESTIADVAFMAITMQDLQETIIREGTTCEYKNGANQYGTKQSPEMQVYTQLSQKHTSAMKILLDCLPKSEKAATKSDGFDDFVNEREDV